MAQTEKTKAGGIRITSVILILILIVSGILIIYSSYADGLRKTEKRALVMAETVETFLCSHFESRIGIGSLESAEVFESDYVREGLSKLHELNESVLYIYLYTMENDKIHILMDSVQPGSKIDFSQRQKLMESIGLYRKPLTDGTPMIIKPSKEVPVREISVIIPVYKPGTDDIIAAFGMDYPQRQWYAEIINNVAAAVVIVICSFLLTAAFLRTLKKNEELSRLSKSLEDSEELFRTAFEQAPIGIAISNDTRTININRMFEKITGRTREEMEGSDWTEITHPDDLDEDLSNFERLKAGEIDSYSMNKRYIRPDGTIAWVNMVVAMMNYKRNAARNHLCLVEDITERKRIEQALLESERSKSVLLSHLPGMAYRCNYDRDWTMQFVSDGCYELTGYKPESLIQNRDLSFNELIAPEYRKILWKEWKRVLNVKNAFRYEYEIVTASGERKWVLELGQGIFNDNGEVEALEGIVIDITIQKKRESQIKYMSNHDFMTGLYNRSYFEREMERMDRENLLPLSIIIGNIDGLRLINDAFGHLEGDRIICETAKLIQKCCRKQDIAARTAGDEFSILMPNTDRTTASEMMYRIIDECELYNKSLSTNYNISISLGYGVKDMPEKSISDAVKEAEEHMHNRKLLNQKSSHSAILSSIMTTMYIRSQETEEHAKRLAEISKKIGALMNLSPKDMDNLELLSMLHDIGKVGIDDGILNKPGKLNDDEWKVMKKHCEIGYRIAMASVELEYIAEYILSHHERWDGKGYPRGLKGEEIPLLSRILAIADAYDAMTEDRVYRKAMSHEAAIEEIKRNAGTQFDPYIAKLFTDNA